MYRIVPVSLISCNIGYLTDLFLFSFLFSTVQEPGRRVFFFSIFDLNIESIGFPQASCFCLSLFLCVARYYRRRVGPKVDVRLVLGRRTLFTRAQVRPPPPFSSFFHAPPPPSGSVLDLDTNPHGSPALILLFCIRVNILECGSGYVRYSPSMKLKKIGLKKFIQHLIVIVVI